MLSSRHIRSKAAISQMSGQPSEDFLEELEARGNSLLSFKGLSQTMIKMSQFNKIYIYYKTFCVSERNILFEWHSCLSAHKKREHRILFLIVFNFFEIHWNWHVRHFQITFWIHGNDTELKANCIWLAHSLNNWLISHLLP